MIDLKQHEAMLEKYIAEPDIRAYAMERMQYGTLKYENPVQVQNANRDYLAEAREEFIDGVNRIIMEMNKRGAPPTPLMDEIIFTALAVVRGVSLLK